LKTTVLFTGAILVATYANADIYQWHDGDADGSLWLHSSTVEPYLDLSGETLWWADLSFANLHHSNFSFTNLSYAALSNANLKVANLSYANLYDAMLNESALAYSSFVGANLDSADITNANLFHADFSDANLSNVENWESAFWIAARYNNGTIFPDGMNPDDYAMIEVPVPSILYIAGITFSFCKQRRR